MELAEEEIIVNNVSVYKNKKKKKKRELSIMCYLFLTGVSLAIRGVGVFKL